MKFTQILLEWKNSLVTFIDNSFGDSKALTSFAIAVTLVISIWIFAPYLNWDGFYLFASPQKRFFIILILALLWILKWLVFDLVTLDFSTFKNPQTRNILFAVQSQLHNINTFLNKNSLLKNGSKFSLSKLPWLLLLGPPNTGKTSLLCQANLHFILKPQWFSKYKHPIKNTAVLNAWLTRDGNFLDVPGHFFAEAANQDGSLAWQSVVRLIKKYRGKNGINGFFLVLPANTVCGDHKAWLRLQETLISRMEALTSILRGPIPCVILINKADLIPGFKEFFAELSVEDATQPWGVAFPQTSADLMTTFVERFNALIKKLNQQLIPRLHYEKNALAKPLIKDFPLQLERLKELLGECIKKLSADRIQLQGIYFTSACQPAAAQNVIINNSSAETTLQVLQEPKLVSRPFFIRYIFHHAFALARVRSEINKSGEWFKRMAYVTACLIIAAVSISLYQDFNSGLGKTQQLHAKMQQYKLAMQSAKNQQELLQNTTKFLDILYQELNYKNSQALDLARFFHFYSQKSQEKTLIAYQQALKNTLLFETKNYFEHYLRDQNNLKDKYQSYAVLQAYLMLNDYQHFDPNTVIKTFASIAPAMGPVLQQHFLNHLQKALLIWQPLEVNHELVQYIRHNFLKLPITELAYVILSNLNDNYKLVDLNLRSINAHAHSLTSQHNISYLSRMYTVSQFAPIVTKDITDAATQADLGNWILGYKNAANVRVNLVEQLRIIYINHYIDAWESAVKAINLAPLNNLRDTQILVGELVSTQSPLLALLGVVHDNTYFEPIVSSSPLLQQLGKLLDSQQNNHPSIYEIFSSLKTLNQYLIAVTDADNPGKAAFEAVASRMQDSTGKDPITHLRAIAENSPPPLKSWLNTLANKSWQYLMQDAARYIDISWREKVAKFYQTDIANRYPFSTHARQEVELQKFSDFFGRPGVMVDFYHNYLKSFIDVTDQSWHWKTLDNLSLPFTSDSLHRIQQALQIHQIFFPDHSNKPYVKFALRPYKLSKHIQRVAFNFNDKEILDVQDGKNSTHLVLWPATQKASVEIKYENNRAFSREYSGDWAWFKLINQSFESALTKKGMLLNLSKNEFPAHYILFTNRNFNPFLAMNLRYFNLPATLMTAKK